MFFYYIICRLLIISRSKSGFYSVCEKKKFKLSSDSYLHTIQNMIKYTGKQLKKQLVFTMILLLIALFNKSSHDLPLSQVCEQMDMCISNFKVGRVDYTVKPVLRCHPRGNIKTGFMRQVTP